MNKEEKEFGDMLERDYPECTFIELEHQKWLHPKTWAIKFETPKGKYIYGVLGDKGVTKKELLEFLKPFKK